ncbi:MAG: HAMP domain-containing histidine kinase [Planctomycetaceae bacterium]|nr:HAMP domain-containing histidine kinase [Planctomycetaceae bacterium]
MLFTRSIRRKMAFLLALVAVMLLVSTVSGLASLRWYYNAIRELDFSVNEMPRRGDLDVAVGGLFEPLLAELPPDVQRKEFSKALWKVRQEIDQFRRKLANVPQSTSIQSQRAFSDPTLVRIDNQLRAIDQIVPHLGNPETRAVAVNDLRLHAEILVGRVQDIPDPQTSLSKTITNAVEGYDTRVGWIVGSGVVVLVLFLSVLRYGYCGIFGPLRQLHRGARRVAQGDFDYRVKLKRVNTDDEIHELADAFNRMTDRFQEITRDLDAQVQERSQQLVRSERLAGIGFLSAGVAHEINNPLSAIAMAAESLDDRSEELFGNLPELDRKLVRQYLSMIQRESFRCQQITRRLLDFARGQDGANQRFDLTGTIIEVLEMVGHMGKYRERNITLRHTGPVHLEGNGPEIKQVVLNLVANSLEAMEDGGTLDIGVTEQTDAIVILFKDDGCGMTEDVIAHLFEPFFTKRKGGKGTGLGLSISHRIVADHGGTIEATSEGLGKGSTFRVRLPRRVATKLAA